MNDLIEPHEPVFDCDCGDCARHERNRLREALKKANSHAEHFEREWYLRGDEIERMRETLKGIVDADWKRGEELATPDEFVRWAKSRALHALTPNV